LIVQEIHELRRRILEACEGDGDRLIARLKAAEAGDKDRLVSLADLQEQAARADASDWKSTVGMFADDPDFDEILRLGREYRRKMN
jgi:hypothetical protein